MWIYLVHVNVKYLIFDQFIDYNKIAANYRVGNSTTLFNKYL